MRTATLALLLAAPLAAQPADATRTEVGPDLALYIATVPAEGADPSVCDTWHGIDGNAPEVIASEGWVENGGRRLDLDVSCMELAMSAELYDVSAVAQEGTDNVLVSGTFSDGAGTAEVAWLVGPVGTVRTRLVSGPALFEPTTDYEVTDRLDVLAEGLATLQDVSDDAVSALAAELYAVLVDLAALLGD